MTKFKWADGSNVTNEEMKAELKKFDNNWPFAEEEEDKATKTETCQYGYDIECSLCDHYFDPNGKEDFSCQYPHRTCDMPDDDEEDDFSAEEEENEKQYGKLMKSDFIDDFP
jgi:Mg2+ and Co2+ transporter CorA